MDAYNAAILKAVSALADEVAGEGGDCCPAVIEAVRIRGGVEVIDGIEHIRAGICRDVVDEITDRYAATLARMMDNSNLPPEEAERLDHEIAEIAAEVRATYLAETARLGSKPR